MIRAIVAILVVVGCVAAWRTVGLPHVSIGLHHAVACALGALVFSRLRK